VVAKAHDGPEGEIVNGLIVHAQLVGNLFIAKAFIKV
jgi:hypothetical protein